MVEFIRKASNVMFYLFIFNGVVYLILIFFTKYRLFIYRVMFLIELESYRVVVGVAYRVVVGFRFCPVSRRVLSNTSMPFGTR